MKDKLLVEAFKIIKTKKFVCSFLIAAIYPAIVLSYVWYHCYMSDFQGGKNGQLDAYRHTLASAVVAYTLSPVAVNLFTRISEVSNEPDNLMDRHNNAIGANLGAKAKALDLLNQEVIQHVLKGAENATDKNQITWLEKKLWKKSLLW